MSTASNLASNVFDRVFSSLYIILKHTTLQFLVLVGLLFVSGLILTFLSKWTGNAFRQFLFPRFGFYLFGVVGVPLHELCHALFAKLFWHDIESIKWFDPKGRGGSYGTVVHYYNDRNIYQRIGLFFIGLGPVLLAPVLLFLSYRFLVPGAHGNGGLALAGKDLGAVLTFTKSLFASQNWHSVGFYFFLYFAICLTSQMELSPDDFKIAKDGVLPILLFVFLLNLVAYVFNMNLHGRLTVWFQGFLALWSVYFLVALTVSFINLSVSIFVLSLINKVFGKPGINPFQGS